MLQYSGRASPSTMEEEDVLEREREAPKACIERPSFPTIYREPRGRGAGPRRCNLPRGRRPRGVECPPRQVVRPPPRVSNPRRRRGPRGGAPAH